MVAVTNMRESSDLMDSLAPLDLSMIRMKLMDHEEGKGWSETYAERVEKEYRRYLALSLRYGAKTIVPSRDVDVFWHYHILDTEAYAADCDRVFGYFLHHFPYFGMRGTEDAQNLVDAYEETIRLYESWFGSPPDDMWPRTGMARCPNCGRR